MIRKTAYLLMAVRYILYASDKISPYSRVVVIMQQELERRTKNIDII